HPSIPMTPGPGSWSPGSLGGRISAGGPTGTVKTLGTPRRRRREDGRPEDGPAWLAWPAMGGITGTMPEMAAGLALTPLVVAATADGLGGPITPPGASVRAAGVSTRELLDAALASGSSAGLEGATPSSATGDVGGATAESRPD